MKHIIGRKCQDMSKISAMIMGYIPRVGDISVKVHFPIALSFDEFELIYEAFRQPI